jgi:hypothetical protein
VIENIFDKITFVAEKCGHDKFVATFKLLINNKKVIDNKEFK